jgi:hypothetical protein
MGGGGCGAEPLWRCRRQITLLFVVFVDLIGQGLVFPVLNGLIMEPDAGFLPNTPQSVRHLDYGLVIGMFFLAWFLGGMSASPAPLCW